MTVTDKMFKLEAVDYYLYTCFLTSYRNHLDYTFGTYVIFFRCRYISQLMEQVQALRFKLIKIRREMEGE